MCEESRDFVSPEMDNSKCLASYRILGPVLPSDFCKHAVKLFFFFPLLNLRFSVLILAISSSSPKTVWAKT